MEKNFKKIGDLVTTSSPVSEIPEGSIGSIIHVYPDGESYEVEFMVGDLCFVETVLHDQIK